MLTRYHSDSLRPQWGYTGHSMDDNHHPVLITKNNFGSLTDHTDVRLTAPG